MDDKDFDDLVESIKQAGEIKKGQRPPGRIFDIHPLDSDEFEESLDASPSSNVRN